MKELIPDDNPSALSVIVTGIIAACGFVAAWLWKHTMGRIDSLESRKMDREEFNGYVARADESRKELRDSVERNRTESRESIAKLFEKIDEVKDMIRVAR